jgi:hypothetical protein
MKRRRWKRFALKLPSPNDIERLRHAQNLLTAHVSERCSAISTTGC